MSTHLSGSIYCFFFKQKTAYEMRISDWSSDVCSSDLRGRDAGAYDGQHELALVGVRRRKWGCGVQGDRLCIEPDRKRVVPRKRVSVRVALGGRRLLKKTTPPPPPSPPPPPTPPPPTPHPPTPPTTPPPPPHPPH